jgi:hypothetical protein
MSTDFERMMKAAEQLQGLTNPADVARFIEQYDQMMTNWKSRGIPIKEIFNIAKKLGCDPVWLHEGDMVTYKLSLEDKKAIEIGRHMKAAQRQAWYHVGNTLAESEAPKNNGTQ